MTDTNGTHSTVDGLSFPITREDGEESRAFEACLCYLKMGANQRSIIKAYREQEGRPNAKQASNTWKQWVKQYKWYERAAIYDEWVVNSSTHLIAEARRESIYEVKGYFDKLNLLIARDLEIDWGLVELLEAAVNEQIMRKNSGIKVTSREIRDLAEARKAIVSGRKECHAQAADLLGFRVVETSAIAEGDDSDQ